MSRTTDRERQLAAFRRGRHEGFMGRPRKNPYSAAETRLHWEQGYDAGVEWAKRFEFGGNDARQTKRETK